MLEHFLGVLCACNHSGLLERGRQIFRDMNMTFKISPNSEHYACYIDLLARGNMLEEALEVVTSMPFKPNNFVWGALLGGCLLHSRVELAQEVSMNLLRMSLVILQAMRCWLMHLPLITLGVGVI